MKTRSILALAALAAGFAAPAGAQIQRCRGPNAESWTARSHAFSSAVSSA